MKKLILISIVLAGCATTPGTAKVISGTESSVIVSYAEAPIGTSSGSMLPVAESHCAQYGKHAQFVAKTADFSGAFNCVK